MSVDYSVMLKNKAAIEGRFVGGVMMIWGLCFEVKCCAMLNKENLVLELFKNSVLFLSKISFYSPYSNVLRVRNQVLSSDGIV